MKKALILGTNAGQADIIQYLNEAGWETHVCGFKRVGPGCDVAHHFHLVDTMDVEAVKKLASDIKADIVYSVSSDSAIRTATRVSQELGLPTLLNTEIVELFHNKDHLRKFLNDNNINTVQFKRITSLEQAKDWNIFPCVVKPTDSQGQRGVTFVENREQFEEAVESILSMSSASAAIVEEFLNGVELSTNIVVQNGKIIVNEFSERLVFGQEYFGLPKGHSIPVRAVGQDTVAEAARITEELISKLHIKDAVLYIQMKITDQGPKIIEIAPRLDGCHIWRLIRQVKGYDLRQYAIDCLTNNTIINSGEKINDDCSCTLAFHHLPTGATFHADKLSMPTDMVYNEFRYQNNEVVQPINGKLEVVGYYICKD